MMCYHFIMRVLLIALVFISSHYAAASTARLGVSPDNSLSLTLSAISTAKELIQINMYQFDQKAITDALVERIHAGVSIQLLIEDEPFEKISDAGIQTLNLLHDAMKVSTNLSNVIFLMSGAKNNGHRRYVYDHAKYMVIDSKLAWVSSDNLTQLGHPGEGMIGDRGWEIILEDQSVVQSLQGFFQVDTSLSFQDVLKISGSDPLPTFLMSSQKQFIFETDQNLKTKNIPTTSVQVSHAEVITAPNATESFQKLIRSSLSSIDFEFMSLPQIWKPSAGVKVENPLVTELLNAAKRGIKVRVLLNDDRVFNPNTSPNIPLENEITAHFLLNQAQSLHLPLLVKIVDVKSVGISYVHNKGVIVDKTRTLISSINGTRNSMINNRELGLVVESSQAASYFGSIFESDWQHSPEIKN